MMGGLNRSPKILRGQKGVHDRRKPPDRESQLKAQRFENAGNCAAIAGSRAGQFFACDFNANNLS